MHGVFRWWATCSRPTTPGRSRARPPNCFRGVYATFADAEASIPPGERVGYDHAELAGLYRHRMDEANQSDYAVLFWLKGILDERSFVFDFGGHVGVSYHGWRSYLDYPPGLRWLVHDVPAIVKVGAELARERPSAGLEFTSDHRRRARLHDPAGGRCDAVRRPVADPVARRGRLAARSTSSSTRCRSTTVSRSSTVQSTGRAFHPYRIYNRAAFVAEATALGYRIVDDWQNREQHCEIPFTRRPRHRRVQRLLLRAQRVDLAFGAGVDPRRVDARARRRARRRSASA